MSDLNSKSDNIKQQGGTDANSEKSRRQVQAFGLAAAVTGVVAGAQFFGSPDLDNALQIPLPRLPGETEQVRVEVETIQPGKSAEISAGVHRTERVAPSVVHQITLVKNSDKNPLVEVLVPFGVGLSSGAGEEQQTQLTNNSFLVGEEQLSSGASSSFEENLKATLQEMLGDGMTIKKINITALASDDYRGSTSNAGIGESNPENEQLAKLRSIDTEKIVKNVLSQLNLTETKIPIESTAREVVLSQDEQTQLLNLARQELKTSDPASTTFPALLQSYGEGKLDPESLLAKRLDHMLLANRQGFVEIQAEKPGSSETSVMRIPLLPLLGIGGLALLGSSVDRKSRKPVEEIERYSSHGDSEPGQTPPEKSIESDPGEAPHLGEKLITWMSSVRFTTFALGSAFIRGIFVNDVDTWWARLNGNSEERLRTVNKDWVKELSENSEDKKALWASCVALISCISAHDDGVPVRRILEGMVKDIAHGKPADTIIESWKEIIETEVDKRDKKDSTSPSALSLIQEKFNHSEYPISAESATKAFFIAAVEIEKGLWKSMESALLETSGRLNAVDGVDSRIG